MHYCTKLLIVLAFANSKNITKTDTNQKHNDMEFDNDVNAFDRGWANLRAIDQPAFMKDIMEYFGHTTKDSFYQRRRGGTKILAQDAKVIEEIFMKYGIEKEDVWGKRIEQSRD